MAKVKVNAGICGFTTVISVESKDKQTAFIDLKTQCPSLKPLEDELKEVDGFRECFGKLCDSKVYLTTAKYCKHPACPVTCAIIKGIEVACGLALPKDVEINITKD